LSAAANGTPDLSVEAVRKNFAGHLAVNKPVVRSPARQLLLHPWAPRAVAKTTLLRMIAGFIEPDSGGDPHRRPQHAAQLRPTGGRSTWCFHTARLVPDDVSG